MCRAEGVEPCGGLAAADDERRVNSVTLRRPFSAFQAESRRVSATGVKIGWLASTYVKIGQRRVDRDSLSPNSVSRRHCWPCSGAIPGVSPPEMGRADILESSGVKIGPNVDCLKSGDVTGDRLLLLQACSGKVVESLTLLCSI
ncbi:hypothetical protein CFOL_v3_17394 [Cephalotus follicularis]|uniref:Uncharacterized protein n=1 Tax=Cephalotus follicularis TaxID=3775 RepID=A0A1Q3C191_CEPFO|nr:hypothetical protein CFOL_v3_17394 [Cephalotus follicularis]